MNVVLLGRTQKVIDDVIRQLQAPGVELSGGTGIEALHAAFDHGPVDHVIVGGGLPLPTRLEIVQEIFTRSNSTTVHLNSPSGPESFLPFVRAVLTGLQAQ